VTPSDIFSLPDSVIQAGIRNKKRFERKTLEIFRLQAGGNAVYKNYLKQIGVIPDKIKEVNQIPFLPIEFFKTHKIITKSQVERSEIPQKAGSQVFLSSGTTGVERSKHYVSDIKLYEKSFRKCFKIFYGDVKQYAILAFLPSYYENKNSSLLYMVNDLMKKSSKKESRFYKNNEQEVLSRTMNRILSEKKKVILFGVSYALLDLTPGPSPKTGEGNSRLFVIETGGMKGRREPARLNGFSRSGGEITREELHKILCEKFYGSEKNLPSCRQVHSEYGMTELLSQAYSKGNGIFNCPPWMKVFVRDANDPFSLLLPGKTGALNIIDLANIHSCSFIATQDVGRTHKDGSFEVLGRMDNSDLRGCNLLAG
jgi:hypothetical protein